jgi:hypothetical protein
MVRATGSAFTRVSGEAVGILPKENLTKEVAIGRIREALLKAVGASSERGEVGSV